MLMAGGAGAPRSGGWWYRRLDRGLSSPLATGTTMLITSGAEAPRSKFSSPLSVSEPPTVRSLCHIPLERRKQLTSRNAHDIRVQIEAFERF
jgi:hypothetical protein